MTKQEAIGKLLIKFILGNPLATEVIWSILSIELEQLISALLLRLPSLLNCLWEEFFFLLIFLFLPALLLPIISATVPQDKVHLSHRWLLLIINAENNGFTRGHRRRNEARGHVLSEQECSLLRAVDWVHCLYAHTYTHRACRPIVHTNSKHRINVNTQQIFSKTVPTSLFLLICHAHTVHFRRSVFSCCS